MSKPGARVAMSSQANALKQFALGILNEMSRTRTFVVAAALSYYFLLSMVPLLIVFSSLLAYLPIPDLFDQLLDLMATVVPPDAIALVQKIMISVLTPHGHGLLSFGVLGYLWSSSGGFAALIQALDIAYGVEIPRPWWRTRLRALLLTFTTGALFTISLLLLVAGSNFGHLLAMVFPVPEALGHTWPIVRLTFTFATFLAAVLSMYLLGPNTKVTLRSALPGAVLAVLGWFLGSFGFTFYLKRFANYDITYGALGAVIVLMLWFYIISIVVLLGAEVNAQLARRKAHGEPLPVPGEAVSDSPAA